MDISLPYTVPDPTGYQWFMLVMSIVTALYGVPQMIHIQRTRSAKDVSISTWVIATVSNVFWTYYGLGIQNVVVFVSSAIGLVCALIISIQAYVFRAPGAYQAV
jgi:uncharacterized protein with PQ loop repeat